MPRMSRIADIATFVAGATAVVTAGQILLMPQFYAWEADLSAVFMRELPQ